MTTKPQNITTIDDAIAFFNLRAPFDLLDLKNAYRDASLKAHPDKGGTEAAFIQVNRAYDLLKSQVQETKGNRWDDYRKQKLKVWKEIFRAEWKEVCEQGLKLKDLKAYDEKFRYGLNYSTCIVNFSRRYTEPLDEWFLNCVYSRKFLAKKLKHSIPHDYREHLIQIAPNKLMAEIWARKYFQLEFGIGIGLPWVFYLKPAP